MNQSRKTITYVSLDADHQGHLLSVLADAHTLYNTKIETTIELLFALSDMDQKEVLGVVRGYTHMIYLVGNVEGKLLRGMITEQDMKMLEEWEEEVEEYNQVASNMLNEMELEQSYCDVWGNRPCSIACPVYEDCAGK